MDKRVEERIRQKLEPHLTRISEQRDDEHDMLPALFGVLLEQQRMLDAGLHDEATKSEDRAKVVVANFKHQFDELTKRHAETQQEFDSIKERHSAALVEISALRKSTRLSIILGATCLTMLVALLVLRFVK